MSKTVFIAGSISITQLDPQITQRIERIIARPDLNIIIGDAQGADARVQAWLADKRMDRVTVYHVYHAGQRHPRNNAGGWPTRQVATGYTVSRASYTVKDLVMAEDADYGLMIWDKCSPGTHNNIVELLKRGKPAIVYLVTAQGVRCVHVTTESDLQALR